MGLSSKAIPAQFLFPTELLRGEGNLFINRDITQGQSGVRKIKRRLPFLEIVDCHLLGNCYSNNTKKKTHNEYKEWRPLELFNSHLIQSQWQSTVGSSGSRVQQGPNGPWGGGGKGWGGIKR